MLFSAARKGPVRDDSVPQEQFSLFDVDGNGFITKEELMKISKELGLQHSFTPEVITQMFQDADLDGDGQISFQGSFPPLLS